MRCQFHDVAEASRETEVGAGIDQRDAKDVIGGPGSLPA